MIREDQGKREGERTGKKEQTPPHREKNNVQIFRKGEWGTDKDAGKGGKPGYRKRAKRRRGKSDLLKAILEVGGEFESFYGAKKIEGETYRNLLEEGK